MLKRTIYLSSPLKISVKDEQLLIALRDSDKPTSTVPIEDLAHVVIENQQVSITIPALNALIRQNVGVIICDDKSMPHILMNPLESNTLQGQRYRTQLEASLPIKKSIWKQIIVSKIANQSRLLNKLGKDGDILKPYYMNVKSDDSDNREGIAAKLYWQKLLGKDFYRSRNGVPPNNLLNYGYTILRASVARAIVGSGMLPALGIHHRNRSNAFPLADDLMEPFRPFVDEVVINLFTANHSRIDKESKSEIINVLYCDTIVNGKIHPLNIAVGMLCTSVIKMMDGECKSLNLPILK